MPSSDHVDPGAATVTSRPLPSLVTSTIDPVSATARLAPVMPTSAWRNAVRSFSRAKPTSSSGRVPSERRAWARSTNRSWICWRSRCRAGAMMWLGASSASCTIHSPRSVSTTSAPQPSSALLRSISSVAIDFDLTTRRAPWRRTRSVT